MHVSTYLYRYSRNYDVVTDETWLNTRGPLVAAVGVSDQLSPVATATAINLSITLFVSHHCDLLTAGILRLNGREVTVTSPRLPPPHPSNAAPGHFLHQLVRPAANELGAFRRLVTIH